MKYFGHTFSAVHESDLDNELLNLIRVPHWMYDQNTSYVSIYKLSSGISI